MINYFYLYCISGGSLIPVIFYVGSEIRDFLECTVLPPF